MNKECLIMPEQLPLPEKSQHLLEKRLQEERRKQERRNSDNGASDAIVEVERRTGADRRQGRRRLDD